MSDDPIAIADEQKRWWISQGVSARRAWFRLTGKKVRDVEWSQVEGWMIRWLIDEEHELRNAA